MRVPNGRSRPCFDRVDTVLGNFNTLTGRTGAKHPIPPLHRFHHAGLKLKLSRMSNYAYSPLPSDRKTGFNMGAKARMMTRKAKLKLTPGLVIALVLLVALPISVVYSLRARRNGSFDIEEDVTSEDDSSALCSPKAFSSGKWVWDPKTNITEMTSKEQALLFSGFDKCVYDRMLWWNLAADVPERYFRFPKAHSYRWEPGSKCQGLSPLEPGALLKYLVEVGGWYIVGGLFPLLLRYIRTHSLTCGQIRSRRIITFPFPVSLVLTSSPHQRIHQRARTMTTLHLSISISTPLLP